jgi:hypothetical protein
MSFSKVFHLLLWLVLPGLAWSQLDEPRVSGAQVGFGFGIRHFGWDVAAQVKPSSQSWSYQLSGGLLRDPREILLINERLPGSKPFRLGKINHGMWLRPGISRVFEMGQRRSRSDLGVAFVSDIHATFAYHWPVYVYMYRPAPIFDLYELKRYEPEIDESYMIGGMASPLASLGEGRWIPGMGASLSVRAEWGNYRNMSNSLALGASFDALASKLPLMQNPTQNRSVFPALFVNFAFALDL